MPDKISNPIFFDEKQRRRVYSRRSVLSLVVFLCVVFGVLVASILIRPNFPVLDLAKPQLALRNAPNVPRPETGILQMDIPGNGSFDITVPQTEGNTTLSGKERNTRQTKVLGFYVNWDENSLTSLKGNINKLDILVPEWLHLADENGSLSVDDQARQDETLAFVRAVRPGLPIAPLINNFNGDTQGWDGVLLGKVLSSQTSRQALVRNILGYIRRNDFIGVSIDFESIPDASQANMTLFMKELYGVFHPLGLQVSQNIPLDDPAFRPQELGKFSDYLILMAYDEHSLYDTSAGPIASQGWFARALSVRLQELPAEKYVIAVGNYGYDWTEKSTGGTEMTFEDAMTTARESQGVVVLDALSLNPTYDYYDDNAALHHVWFLDAVSLFDEIYATKKLTTPYGYALWRLGSEDPTAWTVFAKRDALGPSVADALQNLQYGYDVNYEGSGEILRVTGSPKDGKREIRFDTVSGFITSENISDFPAPYVITRWGGADPKKIALTFDDGPDAKYTPQILNILKQYNVNATFFVMGMNANLHPSLLRRIVNQGNEVGNHTYTHPDITMISPEQFQLELSMTERLLEGILGQKSLLFRPPYAEDIEPTTPEQVAPLALTNSLGYYTIGMHIDPRDWSRPGTDAIVDQVMSGVASSTGNVILLHDSGGNRDQTVAALPKIIEWLQSNGFQVVTISDLLGLPRESIMPAIGAKERLVVFVNQSAFLFITGLGYFLSLMFIVGIILGIVRFFFIGILAIAQYAYTRFGRYRRTPVDFSPSVAVIIPALNEVSVIVRTVSSILSSTYPYVRIIAVDDGSEDGTLEELLSGFRDNPRVTILTQKNSGKAQALNFGIAHTSIEDEIIVTLDADTLFCPDTIEKLIRRFIDRRIGAVAGNAKVGNRLNILTRWQALEYITSQNLDRRAFEVINCISVVPGAVGAWRRQALLEASGFSGDTLAEDADLTFGILRKGYRVAYDDEALAYTEAPDTVKNFIKQRFRWMFGTLQVAWKHKDTLFRPQYGSLGFFAVPNIFVFQVFFPLISPLMDLTLVFSLFWAGWQKYQHPVSYSTEQTLQGILTYYILFLIIDMLTATLPFFLERKEQWSLLFFLPFQRFFYRQLMYYVAIKATFSAIKGRLARWGKFERKATAKALARN